MWESSMMFNVSPKDDFPSFRMPLSPVVPGFNIDENGLPRKTPAGAETILADELREPVHRPLYRPDPAGSRPEAKFLVGSMLGAL
jgi:hypothetical protein